jgi:hypothetical protein
VLKVIAVAFALAAVTAASASAATYHSSSRPLTSAEKAQLKKVGVWHKGCPVSLDDLRILSATYRGFDRHSHNGQVVVNKTAAAGLATVFGKLYALHFPIRRMTFKQVYGAKVPFNGDVTGSFECRQAVPSPCSGGSGTGNWSNHAYGLAVDINPQENPYVGCGQSRDPKAQLYRDRSVHRKGMVTRRVIGAFASIGWGWGGSWTGNTKDYMHFSHNGH